MIINSKFNTEKILVNIFKFFVVINLFFPMVFIEGRFNVTIIFSNVIAFLAIILLIRIDKNEKSLKNNWLFHIFIVYNIIFFYFNIIYHHYYIEQLNKSISFLVFILLFTKIDLELLNKYKFINWLINIIIINVLLSLIFFACGYESINFSNLNIEIWRFGELVDEKRLTWIYSHKSTYSIFIMLFLTLIFEYRKDISKLKFIFGVSILLIAQILTKSVSAYPLIALICFIYVFTYIIQNGNRIYKWLLCSGLVISLTSIIFYILNHRNILTLGSRIPIFKSGLKYIQRYPLGVGKEFGFFDFYVEGLPHTVTNLHNVFLNEIIRFSWVMGGLYFIVIILFFIFCIQKKPIIGSVLFVGVFIMLNMDFSLETEMLTFFTFLLSIIFMGRGDNKDFNL